ncbi:unnamed protein product [Prorocentrum cordatum]|uniref:Uncharacterized protein n=1 Tax=Prorocentrum cordatum TaxID=2364126 RepID=A0ABN9VCW4_9DINO|nr:unnamed protein product [Polarella glacialis]
MTTKISTKQLTVKADSWRHTTAKPDRSQPACTCSLSTSSGPDAVGSKPPASDKKLTQAESTRMPSSTPRTASRTASVSSPLERKTEPCPSATKEMMAKLASTSSGADL